jgi:hypothetical protein
VTGSLPKLVAINIEWIMSEKRTSETAKKRKRMWIFRTFFRRNNITEITTLFATTEIRT